MFIYLKYFFPHFVRYYFCSAFNIIVLEGLRNEILWFCQRMESFEILLTQERNQNEGSGSTWIYFSKRLPMHKHWKYPVQINI